MTESEGQDRSEPGPSADNDAASCDRIVATPEVAKDYRFALPDDGEPVFLDEHIGLTVNVLDPTADDDFSYTLVAKPTLTKGEVRAANERMTSIGLPALFSEEVSLQRQADIAQSFRTRSKSRRRSPIVKSMGALLSRSYWSG